MKKSERSGFVEVYEVEPGKGRPNAAYKAGALEFLPTDAPLPQVGDVILLPRSVTGDTEEQAYVMMGMLTPFRVIEREFLYYRNPDEEHDPVDTKPARYLKTWIHVCRLTKEEYRRDPGSAAPAVTRRKRG